VQQQQLARTARREPAEDGADGVLRNALPFSF